jgi:hypothetical protein
MKKKLWILGLCAASFLLLGALTTKTVDKLLIEPRTVSSWGELVDCYLVSRTSLPPLPFIYDEALTKMQADDWSFLADHWQCKQGGGVYYVAENSKMAGLKLPLYIRVYENLQRGELIILSSADGENFQGEALFKAPEFMPYEKDFPLDRYAFDELAPRRVVWEITLKAEADAWTDLMFYRSQEAVSQLLEDGGMMLSMSVPEANTNDLWLCLETQTNGIYLNVFAPEGFTNRVEVYSCADLVSSVWSLAEQNVLPSGTNPAVLDASGFEVRFYAAGNMDVDSDEDGLPDAREKFIHKTDPDDADTDGDGMPDGWELEHGFNPLFYADGGFDLDGDGLNNAGEYLNGTDPNDTDSDNDGMPDGWEVAGGLDPLTDDTLGDPDGDSINNLTELNNGTHPQIANVTPPTGTGRLLFRYDDDGRLTESHLNNASAELFILSPAHNATGLNVFSTEE